MVSHLGTTLATMITLTFQFVFLSADLSLNDSGGARVGVVYQYFTLHDFAHTISPL